MGARAASHRLLRPGAAPAPRRREADHPRRGLAADGEAHRGELAGAIAALRGRTKATRVAVLRFDAARLAGPLVPEPPYTAYEQLIGLTQHDLYHAGQISLLKRAIRGSTVN
jgi:hypothetical protein